jgi:hypothetical protein
MTRMIPPVRALGPLMGTARALRPVRPRRARACPAHVERGSRGGERPVSGGGLVFGNLTVFSLILVRIYRLTSIFDIQVLAVS